MTKTEQNRVERLMPGIHRGSASWPEGLQATARGFHSQPCQCGHHHQSGDSIYWHRTTRDSKLHSGWHHAWCCEGCHSKKIQEPA